MMPIFSIFLKWYRACHAHDQLSVISVSFAASRLTVLTSPQPGGVTANLAVTPPRRHYDN